jgi:hypothetical protein
MMWRRLVRWLAPVLVIGALALPVFGQSRPPGRMQYKDQEEEKEHGPPALQYTVAAVSTIIILIILCMPSRKRHIAE